MSSKIRALILTAAVGFFAVACGASVRLDPPTIPTPLIEKHPMSVAVRLPDNFESFVHEEQILGRETWKIDLGRSNAVFFTDLFSHMFEQAQFISADADVSVLNVDALIEPSIDAFEFSVPNQTKSDAFAVWIRYRIKIFGRDGEMIVDWPVSAYGKSLTTTMGGSDALRRAAVLAMRDAAALMIMKIDDKLKVEAAVTKSSATSSGMSPPEAVAQETETQE